MASSARQTLVVGLVLLTAQCLVAGVLHGGLWAAGKSAVALGVCLLALHATWRAAGASRPPSRTLWQLATASLVLWTAGIVHSAVYHLVLHRGVPLDSLGPILFFLFGLPVAAGLFLDSGEMGVRLRAEIALDVAQILLLATFAYVYFLYLPGHTLGIGGVGRSVFFVYDAEGIVLAAAFLLRAQRVTGAELRAALQRLAGFFAAYSAGSVASLLLFTPATVAASGWFDLEWEVPFVLLACLAARWPPHRLRRHNARPASSTAVLVTYGAAPFVPLLALLITPHWSTAEMGVTLMFVLGSLACSGLRLGILYHGLRRALAGLQASEQRYRALTEQAAEGVALLDPDSLRVLETNPALQSLIGRSAGDLTQLTLHDLILAEPSRIESLMAMTRTQGKHLLGTLELRGADGAPCDAEINTAMITLADRDVIWMGVRDLRQRRQLELQLRQAQKMEAVGRLAGGIAHDFNNLLTVILGRVELLLIRPALPAAMVANLEEVRVTALRAAALVRQLLTFSRSQKPSIVPLQLNALLAGLETLLHRTLGEMTQLRLDLAARADRISADPAQVEQVVLNLAINARDAMPQGGCLTLATAETQRDGLAMVELRVTDSGEGMNAETLSHIFEPFFTTKAVGNGTGLGLSIVYGIAQQSGAQVAVESTPGQGSTFRVFWPYLKETVALVEPPS